MRNQWIASEHHRLHTVEGWPDSPHKEATLRAIHSALGSLMRDPALSATLPPCEVCLSRRRSYAIVQFPVNPEMDRAA